MAYDGVPGEFQGVITGLRSILERFEELKEFEKGVSGVLGGFRRGFRTIQEI